MSMTNDKLAFYQGLATGALSRLYDQPVGNREDAVKALAIAYERSKLFPELVAVLQRIFIYFDELDGGTRASESSDVLKLAVAEALERAEEVG